MNKKLIIALLSIIVMLPIGIRSEVSAQKNNSLEVLNMEDSQKIDNIKDFKENRDKAKEWADKEFKKWNKELKSDQKKAFEEMKKINFNDIIEIYGTDLSGMAVEDKDNKKNILQNMKKIDKALSSKNAKLNESLKVYQSLSAKELSRELIDETIFLSNGQIDAEQYQNLKESLIGMRYESYKIVDVAYTPENNKGFKLEISLPKGENVGYAFENQVVLQKDKALEVTKMSQIVEKGKKKIKIEAKLVEKDKINQKIIEEQNKENKKLNDSKGFQKGTKLLDYRFSSAKAEFYSEKVKDAFLETNERMDTIFNNVLDYMAEKNGKFYFVDRLIATFPEAYVDGIITEADQDYFWTSTGLTLPDKREMFIDMREADVVDTFVHEAGHMVDRMLGQKMGEGERGFISNLKEFKTIFINEQDKLTEYASTNEAEFFAEAFRMYYSNDLKEKEQLQKEAPETYEFIEKYMNELINNR